jgi:hypothetical protein
MSPGLTPEQKEKAVQAGRDIQWNDKQIERWERLYRKAASAGDFDEAETLQGLSTCISGLWIQQGKFSAI